MELKNPYLIAILIQFTYAGMNLISKAAFNGGLNSYVFIFYRQVFATIFLLPLAVICERKSAARLTFLTMCKIFVIAFIGITVGLNCYSLALVYTSATLVSASFNSVPVVTFVFAVLLRMEKVKIKTRHGIAKIIGLGVCLGGVCTLAFYKGPFAKPFLGHLPFELHHNKVGGDPTSSTGRWILGCFLAFISVTLCGLWIVLQAVVLKSYPSKLYFTGLQCLSSTLQSFVVAIAMERDVNQWKLGWNIRLLAVVYSGIMVNGVSFYLQAWVIENKGPVFQAMTTPLTLVLTIIGSFLLLGEVISLGSIIGGTLLVASLYIVLWAKSREQHLINQECLLVQHERNSIEVKETETEVVDS